MILWPTTMYENARSALECGPATRDRLGFRTKVRRLTDTALEGVPPAQPFSGQRDEVCGFGGMA
jgi:hypothetical protein